MNTPYKQQLLHKHHGDSTLPFGCPKKDLESDFTTEKSPGVFFTMALDTGRNLYIP